MADITSTVPERSVPYRFTSPTYWKQKVITPVDDGAYAAATHNVLDIEVGEALLGGYVIVTTAVTSTGSATIQWKVGSNELTGAIDMATHAVNKVYRLESNDFGGTDNAITGYAQTTADTLDMVVGTAQLSAGTIILMAEFTKPAEWNSNG